jgi:hypothetical protein
MTSGRFTPSEASSASLIELEIGKERHDETRGGALADCGGIEHRQRQMPIAVGDIVELFEPDRDGGARLREGCSGSEGHQGRAERR